MTVHNYNPDIELEFVTGKGSGFRVKSLYSYQSTRTLDDPIARAAINLYGDTWKDSSLKGEEILKTLSLHDLCKVWIRDGAGKKWLDIFGLVQGINPSIVERDGVPEKGTLISLVGLGESLVRYQVFWHPHIAGQTNLGGIGWLLRAKGKPPSGTPSEVLSSIFDTFFNDKYIFTLQDGRQINKVISKQFEIISYSLSVIGLSAMGMEGSLWATMKRYSDAPWNELFVDVAHEIRDPFFKGLLKETGFLYGNSVDLYLRATPFDLDKWRKLAAPGSNWGFEYYDSDRMGAGEQLSKNTDGIYNFFWVPAKAVYSGFDQLSMAFNQSGGKLPVYDTDSIRKYGLRRLEQGTEYVQIVKKDQEKSGWLTTASKQRMQIQSDTQKITDILIKRTKQLHYWFGYDEFLEGTISTRGRIGVDSKHGARIGGVITRKRDEYQFYITGIQQNWTFPGPHTTILTVSRGHYPKAYREWVESKAEKVYAIAGPIV